MNIGSRSITPSPGGYTPPYVIAELGVNHDGSVDRALALVDAAATAGADAIKLQLFRADLLMSKAAKLAAYQTAAGEHDPVEMLRRLELSIDQMAPIVARAHARGLHAIVTVFTASLIPDSLSLPWDAYKTASPDIVHQPLLSALAATGKPIIISTGASTLDEVRRAVHWLTSAHDRLAILQCVSSYPTPQCDAAFDGIAALAAAFPTLPIGYSDHLASTISGAQCVIMGAALLEKHFTYNRDAPGPDHAASLDAPALADYITLARIAARTLALEPDSRPAGFEALIDGTPVAHTHWFDLHPRVDINAPSTKRVLPCEHDVRAVSRQSIVTLANLPAGHALKPTDLTFKRPGTGLLPFNLPSILGRKLKHAVEADIPLKEADLV